MEKLISDFLFLGFFQTLWKNTIIHTEITFHKKYEPANKKYTNAYLTMNLKEYINDFEKSTTG